MHGKTLIIGGSNGMYGAPFLAATAALKVGSGYVSVWSTRNSGMNMSHCKDLMIDTSGGEEFIYNFPDKWECAIGIGPGLGQNIETKIGFIKFLKECSCPIILDADALNIVAREKLLNLIPPDSILTPHQGEFKRLLGYKWKNGKEKLIIQQEFSNKYKCYVVLKGPITSISTPKGHLYFNITGNPSLAVAGSGDVLTGMITGLFAQNNSPFISCLQAVYLHGLAADIYIRDHHERCLTASVYANILMML